MLVQALTSSAIASLISATCALGAASTNRRTDSRQWQAGWAAGLDERWARACGTATPNAVIMGTRPSLNSATVLPQRPCGCAHTHRCAVRTNYPRASLQNSSTASGTEEVHKRATPCITSYSHSQTMGNSPARNSTYVKLAMLKWAYAALLPNQWAL